MSRLLLVLAASAALLLAACSGGGTTPTAGVSSPEPAASASAPAASGGAGAGTCAPSTEPGTVEAAMGGNAFSPATITAKVGDVIAWTNGDSVPHTATLRDDPACTTENLGNGETGALTFSAAGTYEYFCKVHPDMAGTIEVTS
jgi:plastocyanin